MPEYTGWNEICLVRLSRCDDQFHPVVRQLIWDFHLQYIIILVKEKISTVRSSVNLHVKCFGGLNYHFPRLSPGACGRMLGAFAPVLPLPEPKLLAPPLGGASPGAN